MSDIVEFDGRGHVEPRELSDEMRASYLDYAMSVIVGRALPDVRDGLKPVHRRVLYSMYEAGLAPNRPYVKCASVVGDTMGRYHPHGDSAIYDTLVRLAQSFSSRYPLVDGQGNFGNIDGYAAAAMRYTECRLTSLALEMLRDLDPDIVDFGPNYDGSRQQPLVLPSRFPNLLVNGSTGIAVGMATNIPPHNLGETIDAVVALIDNPDVTVEDLMEHLPGPGLPDRRHHHGPVRHPRGVRHGPRPHPRARPGRDRGARQRPHRDRRHRAAVHGAQGRRRRRHLPHRRAGERRACCPRSPTSSISTRRASAPARCGSSCTCGATRSRTSSSTSCSSTPPLQTTFGANMVALVDGVPRTLGLRRADHALPRAPEGRRHPPHAARAAQGRGARAHPRGLPRRARSTWTR